MPRRNRKTVGYAHRDECAHPRKHLVFDDIKPLLRGHDVEALPASYCWFQVSNAQFHINRVVPAAYSSQVCPACGYTAEVQSAHPRAVLLRRMRVREDGGCKGGGDDLQSEPGAARGIVAPPHCLICSTARGHRVEACRGETARARNRPGFLGDPPTSVTGRSQGLTSAFP